MPVLSSVVVRAHTMAPVVAAAELVLIRARASTPQGCQARARPLCGHIIPCEWHRTVAVDVSATDDEEAGWRGAALS